MTEYRMVKRSREGSDYCEYGLQCQDEGSDNWSLCDVRIDNGVTLEWIEDEDEVRSLLIDVRKVEGPWVIEVLDD